MSSTVRTEVTLREIRLAFWERFPIKKKFGGQFRDTNKAPDDTFSTAMTRLKELKQDIKDNARREEGS